MKKHNSTLPLERMIRHEKFLSLRRSISNSIICLVLALSTQAFAQGKFTLCGNLGLLSYYDSTYLFVDIMKQSSPWRLVEIPSGKQPKLTESTPYKEGTVIVDEKGWPYVAGKDFDSGKDGFSFITYIVGRSDLRETGRFLVRLEGTGSVTLSDGGFEKMSILCKGGVTQQYITRSVAKASTYLTLTITKSSKDDHIRNVRVILPGHEKTFETAPFEPAYLADIRPFKKIRPMQMCDAPNGEQVEWRDRTPPDFFSYCKMVPYEMLSLLANQAWVDLWVCVPAKANEDYITNMAMIFRDNLASNRVLSVEWANEVANPVFIGNTWAKRMARERFADDKRYREIQVESALRAFRIFNAVFGYRDDENSFDKPERKVRYMLPMDCLETYVATGSHKKVKVDHNIGNFYVGIPFVKMIVESNWVNEPVDFVMDRLLEFIPKDTRAWGGFNSGLQETVRATAEFSKAQFPISYVSYEGGSHYFGMWWNKELEKKTEKMTQALKIHPRGYEVNRMIFNRLNEIGATNDNYIFTINGIGMGQRLYPGEPLEEAARYRACMDYIQGK
jgi:hypothetical protein